MHLQMSKKSDKLSFQITRFFLVFLNLFPLRALYLLSDLLYLLLFYIVKYRKKVVKDNLRMCFPEKSEIEIRLISKKFYKHFSDLMIEGIKARTISEKELCKRVKFKNTELINRYYDEGKSVVLVVSHYNNWEWTMHMQLFTKLHVIGVAKPQSNTHFDKYINDTRRRFKAETAAMADTLRTLLRHKKDNRQTLIGLISDQIPHSGMINYWTTFMGLETAAFLGAEKIAKKLKQPVVFGHMKKIKRGYYEFIFEPLFENSEDTTDHEITNKHIQHLENIIKENPQYWLWTHRRWKYKREKK